MAIVIPQWAWAHHFLEPAGVTYMSKKDFADVDVDLEMGRLTCWHQRAAKAETEWCPTSSAWSSLA